MILWEAMPFTRRDFLMYLHTGSDSYPHCFVFSVLIKMDSESIKKMLRAVLQSSKAGVPLSSVQSEYRALCGENIPLKKLGFSKLEDFLRSIPSVVRLENRKGEVRTLVVFTCVRHFTPTICPTPRHCRLRIHLFCSWAALLQCVKRLPTLLSWWPSRKVLRNLVTPKLSTARWDSNHPTHIRSVVGHVLLSLIWYPYYVSAVAFILITVAKLSLFPFFLMTCSPSFHG